MIALQKLDGLKEEIRLARQEIEAHTIEVFSRLAWKQEHFQDVRLDQDFRLEVIDRWGMPTREELSAGERQILSLSFICAMARVSGEDAPLVMETPRSSHRAVERDSRLSVGQIEHKELLAVSGL